MSDELFGVKELADALKRHRNYVHAMRVRGFIMPGGRATLRSALDWLEKHPPPRSRCAGVQHGASTALLRS